MDGGIKWRPTSVPQPEAPVPHKELEKARQQALTDIINEVASSIPGHPKMKSSGESKAQKVQRVTQYIVHMEESIHDLLQEFGLEINFSKLFLSPTLASEGDGAQLWTTLSDEDFQVDKSLKLEPSGDPPLDSNHTYNSELINVLNLILHKNQLSTTSVKLDYFSVVRQVREAKKGLNRYPMYHKLIKAPATLRSCSVENLQQFRPSPPDQDVAEPERVEMMCPAWDQVDLTHPLSVTHAPEEFENPPDMLGTVRNSEDAFITPAAADACLSAQVSEGGDTPTQQPLLDSLNDLDLTSQPFGGQLETLEVHESWNLWDYGGIFQEIAGLADPFGTQEELTNFGRTFQENEQIPEYTRTNDSLIEAAGITGQGKIVLAPKICRNPRVTKPQNPVHNYKPEHGKRPCNLQITQDININQLLDTEEASLAQLNHGTRQVVVGNWCNNTEVNSRRPGFGCQGKVLTYKDQKTSAGGISLGTNQTGYQETNLMSSNDFLRISFLPVISGTIVNLNGEGEIAHESMEVSDAETRDEIDVVGGEDEGDAQMEVGSDLYPRIEAYENQSRDSSTSSASHVGLLDDLDVSLDFSNPGFLSSNSSNSQSSSLSEASRASEQTLTPDRSVTFDVDLNNQGADVARLDSDESLFKIFGYSCEDLDQALDELLKEDITSQVKAFDNMLLSLPNESPEDEDFSKSTFDKIVCKDLKKIEEDIGKMKEREKPGEAALDNGRKNQRRESSCAGLEDKANFSFEKLLQISRIAKKHEVLAQDGDPYSQMDWPSGVENLQQYVLDTYSLNNIREPLPDSPEPYQAEDEDLQLIKKDLSGPCKVEWNLAEFGIQPEDFLGEILLHTEDNTESNGEGVRWEYGPWTLC